MVGLELDVPPEFADADNGAASPAVSAAATSARAAEAAAAATPPFPPTAIPAAHNNNTPSSSPTRPKIEPGSIEPLDVTKVKSFFPERHLDDYLVAHSAERAAAAAPGYVGDNVTTVRQPSMAVRPPTMRGHIGSVHHVDTELREPALAPPGKALRRALLYEDVQMLTDPSQIINRIVYDVDAPVMPAADDGAEVLQFESRFESGNLRQARQVYRRVYDLVTSPDTNSVGCVFPEPF